MRFLGGLLLTTLVVSAAAAEKFSTRCQAEQVTAAGTNTIDLRFVGCGEGFPDNLLWHLDRADSLTGELDSSSTRTLTGKGAVVYMFDTGVMSTHDELMRADGSVVIGAIHPYGISRGCPNGHDPALDPCSTRSSARATSI